MDSLDSLAFWSRAQYPVHERIDSYLERVDPDQQDPFSVTVPSGTLSWVNGAAYREDRDSGPDHEQIEQLPEACIMCGDDELRVQVTWVGDEIDSTRISCNECGWSTNGKPGARLSMRETRERLGEEVSPFSVGD